MQVTEVARGRFPHIPVCEIVCLRLCLCDFILFFVCVCVHKPVLLQAKNIAMILCWLCVLREREWRKRPSQSTWAGIKVLTREKEWVRDGGREKESERGDRIQAKGGQNREEREASPGGHWVSGSPLLLSHSTFHSNNLTSQPGSRKNEKKYSGGGGQPTSDWYRNAWRGVTLQRRFGLSLDFPKATKQNYSDFIRLAPVTFTGRALCLRIVCKNLRCLEMMTDCSHLTLAVHY